MNPRLVALAPVLALAAACSSSGKGASAPPTTADTSAPATIPVDSPSAAGTSPSAVASSAAPSPSASATPAVDRCHTSQLKATVNDGQGAAGTIFTNVLLLNTSRTTCRLFGYPGLGLKDASGKDLPSKEIRGGGMLPTTPARTVTLAPAVSASFTFTYSDNPTGSDTESACPPASTLVVTPPDERDPLTTPFTGMPCEGRLHVSPVVSGTSGVGG